MSVVDGIYRLEIVGGPYDGVGGFRWGVDWQTPLPTSIRVGWCTGRGECASPGCRRGQLHAAFWHPELEDPPVATVAYALQEDSIEPPADDPEGKARYALGGLDIGRRLETREMVLAGAADPGIGGG